MNSQYKAANIFSDVYVEDFPRNLFRKPFTTSFTANHGLLYPAFCKKVIPGDKVYLRSYGRVQLTPLATNTMQNIKVYMRYFYIPNRIIWDKFDKYMAQDGFVQAPIQPPFGVINGSTLNGLMRRGESLKLLDFLGVQFDNRDSDGNFIFYQENAQVCFTLYKHFAYWLTYDTYFRDENIQEPIFDIEKVVNGYNDYYTTRAGINDFVPIAKEKDYFTTSLPWTQKGEPVTLNAQVFGNGLGVISNPLSRYVNSDDTTEVVPTTWSRVAVVTNDGAGTSGAYYLQSQSGEVNPPTISLVDPRFSIDGTGLSTSISINELRYANALQRYLERLALGGNRPAEFYLSMYGVHIDDLRIGQPKYLGGGSTYIHVTSIAQTVESEDSPLATLAGNGQGNCDFSIDDVYECKEFGWILGLFYIRPELNYTQGISKDMTIFSHLDEYNPIFAHLGEEPVMTSELMLAVDFNNNPSLPEHNVDTTFGYQSRYAYLKSCQNEIHGELKSSLSKWMLNSRFVLPPRLNDTFIIQPQNYAIFSVIDNVTDHYIVELRHDFEVESSMPDFAIPSL